jgi:hypothetical protein
VSLNEVPMLETPAYELRELARASLPRGPVAALVVEGGSVTLELPEWGRVRVAGAHVVVEAASPAAAAALHGALRTWITGQQSRQAGHLVFGGACVERDGRAVVIAARPRNGASFAALGLVRAGWNLVSDGVSVIRRGADGFVAVPGRGAIELDARAIAPDSPMRVQPIGAAATRVLVDVTHTTFETPVAAVVNLVARSNLRTRAIVIDAGTAPARLASTAVRDLSRPDQPHGHLYVADLVGAVPVTTLLVPVEGSTAKTLADAVLDIAPPVSVPVGVA